MTVKFTIGKTEIKLKHSKRIEKLTESEKDFIIRHFSRVIKDPDKYSVYYTAKY